MPNQFLENGKKGKNSWWRYLTTTFLSWGVLIVMILSFAFYFIFFGLSIELLTFLSWSISMIVFYICVKTIHKKDVMSLVNVSKGKDIAGKSISWIKRIRWNKFLKGALLWSIFLAITSIISYIFNPNSFIINFNIYHIAMMILLFIIVIPIQVTFGELFFRGYLLQGLSLKVKSPITIILISSLIFSLGQLIGDSIIFMIQNVSIAFIIGIIFCGFTLVDNGIELATGAHLANSFFAFIISSSERSLGNFNTIIQSVNIDPIIDNILTITTLLIFAFILFLYKKEDVLKALNMQSK
ncbi:MAG: CPBP family intramembrane metalloprotease [Methanobacteriaceae archaeon]|jgi:membrane protease YdiL (CAAX protease family)|nr:CPBP family intramembrane metalloprotease [Candidatus Methanorudis spinitermitis]